MSTQSFADLGVSRPVVRRPAPSAASPPRSPSSRSSSPTCSPAATCSPSRRPAPARRSRSACRSSTASTPTARGPRRSSSRRRASSPRQIVEELQPLAPRRAPRVARRLRRRRPREAGRATRARAHIIVATPGRLEDLLQRRAFTLDARRDARPRRGRPHARHGLPARRRPDRRPVPGRPPDAVLLRHARRRGRPHRRSAYTRDAVRHEHAPAARAARPTSSTASSPSSATTALDALVDELRGRPRPRARLRAHQARRRPARQAPRAARASTPSRCTATSPSASASRRWPRFEAGQRRHARRDRRRRPRHRRRRHLARHQLRPARGPRGLRAPRRPHRPRRARPAIGITFVGAEQARDIGQDRRRAAARPRVRPLRLPVELDAGRRRARRRRVELVAVAVAQPLAVARALGPVAGRGGAPAPPYRTSRAMPRRSSSAVETMSTRESGSSIQSTGTSWIRRPRRCARTSSSGVEEPRVVAHAGQQRADHVGPRRLEAALRVREPGAQRGAQQPVVAARDELALGPALHAGPACQPGADREVAVARQQRRDERQDCAARRSTGRRPCRRRPRPGSPATPRAAPGRGPSRRGAARRPRAAPPGARGRRSASRRCSRCRRPRCAT